MNQTNAYDYPFQSKKMYELQQLKGKKIMFFEIFFHLVCKTAVVTQGSETKKRLDWEGTSGITDPNFSKKLRP